MKHLLEDNNIRLKEDADVFGRIAKAGAKVICVSKQGEFNGFAMRVPPPEFEALMLFNSLEAAGKAQTIKRLVETSKNEVDQILEVEVSETNHAKFFQACQNSMTAITFAVSALESWANKSIAILGQKNGEPSRLVIERPDKPNREVLSDQVPQDLKIPIRVKLFQLLPQVFEVAPLKASSTLRHQIIDLVEDRNIVMHMQQKLNLSNEEVDRVSFAIKLFKTNSFTPTEHAINYMSYIYESSDRGVPMWLQKAQSELKSLKRKLR
ncbi:hypothetical protein [Marinobacter caseinilyticus]|uniref:hypothetical protein n=1 Tax=Marinobacter caseinilyticus TaxID=2692195 RepID=UPI0014099B8C|nr:hypothetical protein [Marinobacter caseinilyticus]